MFNVQGRDFGLKACEWELGLCAVSCLGTRPRPECFDVCHTGVCPFFAFLDGGSFLFVYFFFGRVYISSVKEGSSAAIAGIRAGDVIVAIDGDPIQKR